MEDPISTDVALQFCTMVRSLRPSGARPCAIYTTKAYDSYLKLGDMVLERKKSGEETTRVVLVWTLKNFKAYQKEADREV
jgi:hypothetical protein